MKRKVLDLGDLTKKIGTLSNYYDNDNNNVKKQLVL